MTGQEWYDRFKAQLRQDTTDDPTGIKYLAALEAAKKASGIKQ